MGGKRFWYAVISILILHLVGPSPVKARAGEVVWKNEVALSGKTVVESGDVLRIEPGTVVKVVPGKDTELVVRGTILVKGEKGKPVRFVIQDTAAPGAWKGISLLESKGSRIAWCELEGALKGISLIESDLELVGGAFSDNGTGMEVNQKCVVRVEGTSFARNRVGVAVSLSGEAYLTGSRFESVREVGLVVQNGGKAKVKGCIFTNGKRGIFALTNGPLVIEESTFASMDTGIILRQVGKNSVVKRCRFENNGTGILSVQFSYATISDSVVENNRVGIDVREFSAPHVTHCEFRGNELAVNLFRKSNSLIDYNVFLNNRTALMVDYSSYPGIFHNNFERNDMHLKLGKFQSGDWEERAGSRGIARKEAAMRGSRNIGAFGVKVDYPKRVAARGNFWGTDVGEPGGEPANLEKIWDGMDFGPVTYEGYGDEKYRIDIVDYSEWEREPVKEAGVREKGKDK